MSSLLKIAVFLAVVAATSASRSLCSVPEEGHLDCSGRELPFPPPGLWPNVTELNLSNNTITKLPTNSLTGFPALERLDLSNNSFTRFKFGALATNTNLWYLKIQNNEIESFTPPPRGTTFEHLRYIFAFNNKISHLDPDLFSFAPNLFALIIKNNPLIVEPGHPVLNHPKLQTLDMSFTGLNVVDSSLLAALPDLRSVDLSSANISSVEGAFANNKNLWNILLQGNVITQISPGTFPSEGRLQWLYLNRNPLNSLEPAALQNVFSTIWLSKIDISDTPLACECRYESLYIWAKSKNVRIQASCSGQYNCTFARPP